ncbi:MULTISPECIES: hypothetical protein [unclassified Campylobacter]|nr:MULTISPECIES: hypothetical protein [unclassified Campylobacter]
MPYTLETKLKANKFYSTLGIEISLPEEVGTYSNQGNFECNIY